MVKITKDMVIKANDAVMRKDLSDNPNRCADDFSVSTVYNGKVFTAHITKQDIDTAYAAAYKRVMGG